MYNHFYMTWLFAKYERHPFQRLAIASGKWPFVYS